MLRVMTFNLKHGGLSDGDGHPENRWPAQAALIRELDPDVLCFQEANGWLDNRRSQWADAEADLGMRVHLTPGPVDGSITGVAHKHDLRWRLHDTAHWQRIHGHTHIVLDVAGRPLTVISAHLTPYAWEGAVIEAKTLVARLYRHTEMGILAGDVNHVPADGDGGLDWGTVPAHNQASRAVLGEDGALSGATAVAEAFAVGKVADVALHLDKGIVPTGRGGLRVDQAHVTPDLLPAVVDLNVVDTGELSDHQAVVVDLDLARLA